MEGKPRPNLSVGALMRAVGMDRWSPYAFLTALVRWVSSRSRSVGEYGTVANPYATLRMIHRSRVWILPLVEMRLDPTVSLMCLHAESIRCLWWVQFRDMVNVMPRYSNGESGGRNDAHPSPSGMVWCIFAWACLMALGEVGPAEREVACRMHDTMDLVRLMARSAHAEYSVILAAWILRLRCDDVRDSRSSAYAMLSRACSGVVASIV